MRSVVLYCLYLCRGFCVQSWESSIRFRVDVTTAKRAIVNWDQIECGSNIGYTELTININFGGVMECY